MSEPILNLTDVVVAFDALRAVDGVSLTVPRGQRRAIIGPNGAGKTTLFNAIAGVVPPTTGRITFDGHDVTSLPPHRRAQLGISRTFQITNLFPTLSVQDNMILALRGLSPRKFSLFGKPDTDSAESARIAAALNAARIGERADVIVREMSYGEQRQLEIAIALVTTPTMLLLDEPAAGLSPSERSMVAEIIRSLDRDITVVLIEHDMDLALGLVDHVTCMFEGRVLVEEPPDGIRRNKQVQEVYLGSRVMLEVRDLSSGYGEAVVVRGVSLDVGKGEIVALLGRNGMGKTTFIRSIMGLTPPQIRSGTISWQGESLVGLRPHDIAARKIAIVPQGRRLFPSLTVIEHLTMLKSVRAKDGWTVERVFGIFPRLAERRHHRGGQLSGGERGMLAVGRALMIDPDLILMDEPSEGLAPVMVQHLEDIILDLKREGLSILLVEQNLYSALAVADRVYILETGQIVHQGDAKALSQQTDLLFQRLGVQ